MLSGCWITALLLLLLLLAVVRAQSGDGDGDMEPSVSCTSHIMTDESSLTCKLVRGRINYNDDDDEPDGVEKITACYTDLRSVKLNCAKNDGDTISFRDLSPVVILNVTVDFKRGGKIIKMIDLKKIIKPRSPHVLNVTFNHESNKVLIHIRTPYHKEYLKVKNQLFQLLIWSANGNMVQNISSSDHIVLRIDMQHLQKGTKYQVKVRAIPQDTLQGTWSEWSESFSFFSPADERRETHTLTVCLILLAVMASSAILFWKKKIFTYMWPNIPQPKHTFVQICKPNKGFLLNVKPEVFSDLKIYPMEKTESSLASAAAAAEGTESNYPCSTQSCDCTRSTTSVSTEELELSTLLSRSSSDGEESLQSTSPTPVDTLQLRKKHHTPQSECFSEGNEAEVFEISKQEEAYVTMSSFYQIK